MGVSKRTVELMKRYSWLADAASSYETLVERLGADRVIDLSRGNPLLEPPEEFLRALMETVEHEPKGAHRYMANAGFMETRAAVAESVSSERGSKIPPECVIMMYGASGAVNVIIKALVDKGDEVVLVSPHIPEYPLYVDNHGALPVVVPADDDFMPDLDAIGRAITPATCAVLINSPNNPTGRIYPEPTLRALCVLLQQKERDFKHAIYLISDERYRHVTYDGAKMSDVLRMHVNSVVLASFSKDLAVGAERIGYTVVNPRCDYRADVITACATLIRTLGFVNTPAIMQRAVTRLHGVTVDLSVYRASRDMLCGALEESGCKFVRPEGALYLFAESPVGDETRFLKALEDEGILAVPGYAFGCRGCFRLTFCVEPEVMKRALPGLKRAIKRFASQ